MDESGELKWMIIQYHNNRLGNCHLAQSTEHNARKTRTPENCTYP